MISMMDGLSDAVRPDRVAGVARRVMPQGSRNVWSRLIGRLGERFPDIARRLGDERVAKELPAFGVSVAFHAAVLTILGVMGIAAQAELKREITSQVVDSTVPPFDRQEIQDRDQDDMPAVLNPVGSAAPNVGAIALAGSNPVVVATKADGSEGVKMALANLNVSRPGEMIVPTAATLSQAVSIRGSGAEHVGGVEGAVDRIAMEILNRLGRGKTLVVWAFDASGSLVAEREKLSRDIEKVYAHINDLDKDQIAAGDALMTMVIGFGSDRKAMLAEPTNDPAAIGSAIREVPLDTTGFESTFGTVAQIVSKWGKYKDPKGQSYQTVVIVVTDEVGDDEPQLERAIAATAAAKVPVYVLGSPALFGQRDGRMNYTDPRTKKTYANLVVRQGPESVAMETIRLPFWYGGDQYENLDAGFGPYGLSRLTATSGGIYFVTRMGTSRLTFDPNAMREYRPDWSSQEQYAKAVQKDPIRGAVIQAAMLTQQKLPGQPRLSFPSADSPDFKEVMADNQENVARIAYTVDEALGPIAAVAKLRDRETSRRWRAHYDLIRGRLLAMKFRCSEYQTACAKMKKDAPRFKDPKSNAWRLVPTDQFLSGPKDVALAREAQALLRRVVEDHPGTPWALLAGRELKDPFGFKWVETYVPPPPKRSEAEEVAAKKKAAMKPAKPEEVPKI